MINAILFDTGGVLYHRPRQDRHLDAFLDAHGLKLRDRSIVGRALRAARFDVQTGRITSDAFYDAILRFHGLENEDLFASGRKALYDDAADIELFPGVCETLTALNNAGYRLGTVSDTGHTAGEKIGWLAARGVSPGLWTAFIVSSGVGLLKSDFAIFQEGLHLLGTTPSETAFVGHASDELQTANDLGLLTVAFMPDDPTVESDHVVGSFYGLSDLFLSD